MILARSVYGPEGRLLLNAGVSLTAKYIFFLRQYNVLAVNIQSSLDACLPQNDNILEDEVKLWAATAVRQWATTNNSAKQFTGVVKRVEDIVDEILSGKVPLANLAEISSADTYTFTHSVDVCSMAIYCGIKLNYARSRLILLGIGSLLHDLGKVQVDPDILNKAGSLDKEEFSKIMKHPVLGYSMLKEDINTNIDARSAVILLNHHERFDGTGYPRKLKGKEIDEMSTICAVSDVYNAMVTDRVYRKALPQNEVYEMLLASGNQMFNMETLQAFLQCINPYPEGTFVKLNTGHIGFVIHVDSVLPFRPVLQLIPSGEVVDLKKELSLIITVVPEPHELEKLAKDAEATKNQALA